MSNQTLSMNEALYRYMLSVSLRESNVQRRLREETLLLSEHNMQISPEQGQFMALLVKLMGAHKIIEVGTFTGYSALSMAQSLPEEGRVLCCDINQQWAEIAQRYWLEAEVMHKIDLRIAPALETLAALMHDEMAGKFDMAFIDADKVNYGHYYEACLKLIRKGGLILIDNTLWSGAVVDDQDQSQDTRAIRSFNETLFSDGRVDLSLLPLSDGLTVVVKR